MVVDIAIGIGSDKCFSYSVPKELEGRAIPGHKVVVPLGKRVETGFIVGPARLPLPPRLKDIIDIPDGPPMIPPNLLELARWMSSYYHAPLGLALSLMLPPGLEEGAAANPRGSIEECGMGWGGQPFEPNAHQAEAIGKVAASAAAGKFEPFLLFGATGSGKTEVYIRCIESIADTGKGAIVLVPEIALTPQLVGRFSARFGKSVAVLHSGLTDSQRRLQWTRIRDGKATVAVGARSAIFAPFDNIGLIVVDEEHDGSYKQDDGLRYGGRDVAVMRAKICGCPVVLGSATPSLESYHNAKTNKYTMLSLPERTAGRPMPTVRIIDLKGYPKSMLLTEPLLSSAKAHIDAGRQVLFFINRRGFSDFIICADCGKVPSCPNCSVSYTYHKKEDSLICHLCGDEIKPPELCPKCGGDRMKYLGGGTEKIDGLLENIFPEAGVTRIDRDTTKGRGAYTRLLEEVVSGRSKILVGTQMVAKGHDMPDIGLVGIIMADYGLHRPDFRAAERTFQLLVQAAGRAGRGDTPGEVVIQSYQPEHYSVVHASTHDYVGFYDEEIKMRKELQYPPFSRMAAIYVKGIKEDKVMTGSRNVVRQLKKAASGRSIVIMGPAPAPMKRIRGKYRYIILLRSNSATTLNLTIADSLRALKDDKGLSGCRVDVDVDPQSIM